MEALRVPLRAVGRAALAAMFVTYAALRSSETAVVILGSRAEPGQ